MPHELHLSGGLPAFDGLPAPAAGDDPRGTDGAERRPNALEVEEDVEAARERWHVLARDPGCALARSFLFEDSHALAGQRDPEKWAAMLRARAAYHDALCLRALPGRVQGP